MSERDFRDTRFSVMTMAVAFGFAFWFIDSFVDFVFFSNDSLLNLMFFHIEPLELYMRITVFVLFIVFGLLLSGVMERRAAEKVVLKESEDTLRALTTSAKDAIVMMDEKGNISFWNPAAERIFGYSSGEALGRELHSLICPTRYYETYKSGFPLFKIAGSGPAIGQTLELFGIRKDGTEFPIELSLSSVKIKGQWHATGVIRDITDRKYAEEELRRHRERLSEIIKERTASLNSANEKLKKETSEKSRLLDAVKESERSLKTIFDSIRDPFCIIDRDFKIVMVNEAYCGLKGRRASDLLDKVCYNVLRDKNFICEDCVVEKTFISGDPCAKDKFVAMQDGSEAWVEIYTYPIFDDKSEVSRVIEYTRDITDRKKLDAEKKRLIERLHHLSTTDSLTGLLNRRALMDRLKDETERAKRYGSDLSLILCDMDYFKEINDTYGHTVGDTVLKLVAKAMLDALRTSDVAGRYGGDEFMLILPETSIAGAEILAERIRSEVERMVFKPTGEERVILSTSIGVTCMQGYIDDVNLLIKQADNALYTSKRGGRNRIHVLAKP